MILTVRPNQAHFRDANALVDPKLCCTDLVLLGFCDHGPCEVDGPEPVKRHGTMTCAGSSNPNPRRRGRQPWADLNEGLPSGRCQPDSFEPINQATPSVAAKAISARVTRADVGAPTSGARVASDS